MGLQSVIAAVGGRSGAGGLGPGMPPMDVSSPDSCKTVPVAPDVPGVVTTWISDRGVSMHSQPQLDLPSSPSLPASRLPRRKPFPRRPPPLNKSQTCTGPVRDSAPRAPTQPLRCAGRRQALPRRVTEAGQPAVSPRTGDGDQRHGGRCVAPRPRARTGADSTRRRPSRKKAGHRPRPGGGMKSGMLDDRENDRPGRHPRPPRQDQRPGSERDVAARPPTAGEQRPG
jgi:hypothetical protein